MSDNVQISARLQDFIDYSIGCGIKLVENSCPLIPIVNVWTDGFVESNMMVDLTFSPGPEGKLLCESFISELPAEAEMYALIRDDIISVNGDRQNVLIVEAEERGMKACVQFIQPFVPKRFLRGLRTLGEPYKTGNGKSRYQQKPNPDTQSSQWERR